MTIAIPQPVLKGAKALVVGVANEYSIAYGCARAFHELGAEIALTYVNEKTKGYVEPLAKELDAPIFMQLDVSQPGALEAVRALLQLPARKAASVAPVRRSPAKKRPRTLSSRISASATTDALIAAIYFPATGTLPTTPST